MKGFKPHLAITVDVEGTTATVNVTTDINLSRKNYGQEKKDGQGHIHMYHNNGEKVGITDLPIVLENLEPGTHEVRVSLHNNDHTPYDVTEVVEFTIDE